MSFAHLLHALRLFLFPPQRLRALLATLGLAALPALAQAAPVPIVAAENFYGDLARQIGGAQVRVTSIMSNPDQDPHLFEASPATARALQDARIVLYNGAGYDPWMDELLSASNSNGRTSIVAADLTGHKAGDNPHLWYAPATLPAVARALTVALSASDPAHRTLFEGNLQRFIASMRPIDAKVAALRARYQSVPVTATEPVFGYMADAIGLDMRNLRYQLAAMNATEASPADVAAFEDDLRRRRVRVLIYNRQADTPATRRMLRIAHDAHVPNISVSETEPPDQTYQQWMLSQLDALDKALGTP
ncbi:MAG: zinc ABC transporter substrate-binding protein [Burkholderiaceae bacterium]|jgi:zinc/manganese transport system substrate-binding protein|nr:zinc ABC transporter substrate-binding protein [Burkholderiaceae bacterium]